MSIPHRYGTTCRIIGTNKPRGEIVSIPHRYGTTITHSSQLPQAAKNSCQFLIGMVQQITNANLIYLDGYLVSIPHRYGTTEH